jgi:hypothetical protein
MRKEQAMLLRASCSRFNETFEWDSRTLRLVNGDDMVEKTLSSGGASKAASPGTTHFPFNAIFAIIKVQSMMRRALAKRVTEKRRLVREKDLAVDAAFRGAHAGDIDLTSPMGQRIAERRRIWILQERRRDAQQAMAGAARLWQEKERKRAAREQVDEEPRSPNPFEVRRMGSSTLHMSRRHTGAISVHTAAGVPIFSTETPVDEGVMTVTVFQTDNGITFQAYLSSRACSFSLKFLADSPDPEIADYYQALVSPEGGKLMQVGGLQWCSVFEGAGEGREILGG